MLMGFHFFFFSTLLGSVIDEKKKINVQAQEI